MGLIKPARLQPGDFKLQAVQAQLLQSLQSLQDISFLDGTLVEAQSFTSGTNKTIYHHLKRPVRGWIPMGAPTDAFGSQAVGGGGTYPDITPPRRYYADVAGVGTAVASFTMGFTPADSATLLAVVTHEDHSLSVSSMAQTGVTWARVSTAGLGTSGGVNMMGELWIGHTIASAGTGITVTYSGTFSSALQAGILIVEIPEINATSARNTADVEYQNTLKFFDSNAHITEPVPAAGDLCIAAFVANFGSTRTLPIGSGWRCLAGHVYTGDTEGAFIFSKIAQEAEAQPFVGNQRDSGWYLYIRANFASDLTAGGGGGGTVTTPHGFRQVSSDNTSLTLVTTNNITCDIWVY